MASQTLTAPAAAEQVGVHPHIFRKWVARGSVPRERITPGGRILLPENALTAFLAAITCGANRDPIGGGAA